MPKGRPQPGEGGMDGTQGWGRTYWGGALFFLLLDLEILRQSRGRSRLVDGLGCVLKEGGHSGQSWTAERFMASIDKGTGVQVAGRLFRSWPKRAQWTDLPKLFDELGVGLVGERIVFGEGAPLARWRRFLLRRPLGVKKVPKPCASKAGLD